MRIEAQGKYLQAALEKAQRSISLDGSGTLEASRAQLSEFNFALSNFMENMNRDSKDDIMDMNDFYNKSHSSAFHYQEGEREDYEDQKPKIEGEFDLNIKGSNNEMVSADGAEMESKMLSYRVYNF